MFLILSLLSLPSSILSLNSSLSLLHSPSSSLSRLAHLFVFLSNISCSSYLRSRLPSRISLPLPFPASLLSSYVRVFGDLCKLLNICSYEFNASSCDDSVVCDRLYIYIYMYIYMCIAVHVHSARCVHVMWVRLCQSIVCDGGYVLVCVGE